MSTMTKAELPLLVLFLSTLLLATSVPYARSQLTCEEECRWIPDQSKEWECLQSCSSNGQSCEDRCMSEAMWPQQQGQHPDMCRQQCQWSPHPDMCESACQQQQGQGGRGQCLQQCRMIARDPRGRQECLRTCMQGEQQQQQQQQVEQQCRQQCRMIARDPRGRQECLRTCMQVQQQPHQPQQQVQQQCRQRCQSERSPIRQQECQEDCVGQMMQQEYENQCRSRCKWDRGQCQGKCTEKIRQLELCQEGCQMQGQYGPQKQECQSMCFQQFEQGQEIRMVA